MEEGPGQNRQLWATLHQNWKIAQLEARLARFELRDMEQDAQAGKNPWPAREHENRVIALAERADLQREEAHAFFHRLWAEK